jgi:molybdopterin/thiamine biosynthesis adenylyltransferase
MTTGQRERFKDASWFPKNNERVMIGGAGGIGSWTTFFLIKMGFQATVYDFDTLEEHNLGGQLYRQKDVGKNKTIALLDVMTEFCDFTPSVYTQRIDLDSSTHYYVISAFDNMKARKDLFEVWKKSSRLTKKKPIFIDGRLELEQLQIFCVTPDRISQYEEHLFDDSEVEDAPCTMKQSSHTAAIIGGLMAGFFANHISNLNTGEDMREVPFFYEYMLPMNLTTVL